MTETARGRWPEDHPLAGSSYRRLDSTVACVLTRFELRSAWYLLPMFLAFRRIRKDARQIQGLLKTAFLIEGPRVFYVLSLWTDDLAIIDFGTYVHSHVRTATGTFHRTYHRRFRRPEIWSAQWRLWAVSNNLNWGDFDLRAALDEAGRRAVDEARLGPGIHMRRS